MFNADGLRARMAFGKKYAVKQDKEFVYNFMKTAQLLDGVYRVRFVPAHPEKCPSGWHLNSSHAVEVLAGEKPVRVLAKECYDPEDPEGYLDRLLGLIRENNLLDTLTDGVKAALGKLEPWRRILIPSVWGMRKVSTANGKITYAPDEDSMTPVIWEITANSLLERIGDLFDADPFLGEETRGRNCRFKKQGYKYFLDPEGVSTPFPKEKRHLIAEDYPALSKMGFKDKKDEDAVIALVKSAWWAKSLIEKGVDLDVPCMRAPAPTDAPPADDDTFVFGDDDIDPEAVLDLDEEVIDEEPPF
jgi:hypothetical protein